MAAAAVGLAGTGGMVRQLPPSGVAELICRSGCSLTHLALCFNSGINEGALTSIWSKRPPYEYRTVHLPPRSLPPVHLPPVCLLGLRLPW